MDVMATKWGNDVFEMVDEADIDSDYDSDSVDEDSVDNSGDEAAKKQDKSQRKKGFPAQSNERPVQRIPVHDGYDRHCCHGALRDEPRRGGDALQALQKQPPEVQ